MSSLGRNRTWYLHYLKKLRKAISTFLISTMPADGWSPSYDKTDVITHSMSQVCVPSTARAREFITPFSDSQMKQTGGVLFDLWLLVIPLTEHKNTEVSLFVCPCKVSLLHLQTSIVRQLPYWRWNENVGGELYEYHGFWGPSSLWTQKITSHAIC